MYLFTSALFFLIFFSINNPTNGIVQISGNGRLMTKVERFEYSSNLYQQNSKTPDSLVQKQLRFLLDTSFRIILFEETKPATDSFFPIGFKDRNYMMEVNKINKGQDELNVGKGWLSNTFESKWKTYKQKFADDERAMMADLANSFVHKFPYILFVSLPFFALILKLLYVRRKQFYYSDHAVFTLYHYIFSFILLLFYFLLSEMYDWLQWSILRFFAAILFLSGGVYLVLALKRFYEQGWIKTISIFVIECNGVFYTDINLYSISNICFFSIIIYE